MSGNKLTQGLLRDLFDYRDGFLYRKTKTAKKNVIGQRAASFEKRSGRYTTAVNSKNYFCSRLIFLWHKGYLPELVDHEDGNCGNDRIENLRDATRRGNNANRRSQINSSSVYLGVHSYQNKWRVRISVHNKGLHIGMFTEEGEAALAYNRAAVLYHKEFAKLNIVWPTRR